MKVESESKKNSIEQQRKHFDSVADEYCLKRNTKNHLFLKKLLWQFFFKDKKGLKKNGLQVLEPMSGYCEGKDILQDNLGCYIVYEGFDYSKAMVEKALQDDPLLNVYLMDITKFRPKKKYDLIILIGGLHHVPKYTQEVVSTLAEALTDEGFFISFEPTHNNCLFKKVRDLIYKKNELFDEQTEQAFELAELNKLFLSNNFEIVDQIYPGLLSYIFYYNPDAFPIFNLGGTFLVKTFFNIDKFFFRNFIGKKLSFATLTLFKKKSF